MILYKKVFYIYVSRPYWDYTTLKKNIISILGIINIISMGKNFKQSFYRISNILSPAT